MPELFPYRPLTPMVEALQWTTDIVESFDGGEHRRAVRAIPRQTWEWRVVVEDQRHLSLLRGQATGAFYAPAWQEAVVTTATINSGAGTIDVDTTTGEWRDRVLLWLSPTHCETVAIASITATEITLDGVTSQAYAAGATVAPVRTARLSSSVAVSDTRDFAILELTWTIMDGAALTAYTQPVTYGGVEVFLDSVLLDGGFVDRDSTTPLELLDYGTGVIEPIARYEEGRWTMPRARLRYTGRQDAWILKRWLYRLQGRYGGFLMGSRKREVTIKAAFGSGDTEITIDRIDFALMEQTERVLLFQRHGDQTPIIREVVGATVVDATTETLTLDSALGIAGGIHTFPAIYWLLTCRLDADRVELSWEASGGLEAELPIRDPAEMEVELSIREAPYSPLSTTPTFWTTFSSGALLPQAPGEVSFSTIIPSEPETLIRAVDLIPSAGEFVYGTTEITTDYGTENRHQDAVKTDFVVAIDQLAAEVPNCESVSLVVSWFGTDLRCAECKLYPGVELYDKDTTPYSWTVNGIARNDAYKVSRKDDDYRGAVLSNALYEPPEGGGGGVYIVAAGGDGDWAGKDDQIAVWSVFAEAWVFTEPENGWQYYIDDLDAIWVYREVEGGGSYWTEEDPVYGGTPADYTIVEAITNLKARGYRVTFYPFILMDVPPRNALPNPYSHNAGTLGQPLYPWRGRITCSPAAGYTGTVDQTSTAASQVANFFGSANPGDFNVSGTTVSWTGGEDWGFRRFILHYAHLCAAAGGVDAFLIGSEMRGLTQIRSSATYYPAVAHFQSLLADCRTILGSEVKLSYAADWSEYFGHQPTGGEVFFHLDPLWAEAELDFIGIDNYMPLSDWRDGTSHLDYLAGHPSIYDLDYLQSQVAGGEGFDWFYASDADRNTQTRTTITDGAYDKPWVFRYKDVVAWWSNQHYNRPGGVEAATPTSWTPQSKPIWFTEVGAPAIDKATNQPNVFFDPKSSESFVPYYSSGARDDQIQRQYLMALYLYWMEESNNPLSSITGEPMVTVDEIAVWTWDARPYPAFPNRSDVWGDVDNWTFGHWINGRMQSPGKAMHIEDEIELSFTTEVFDDGAPP